MINVANLIDGHDQYGLWHGTRADVSNGLVVGTDAVGDAAKIISGIWDVICKSKDTSSENLHPDDVTKYFFQPKSLDRAVSIGNSIRFMRKDFHYSVIAFAFNTFAAHGYAREGSELANAILALIDSALLEYPSEFRDTAMINSIHVAQDTASRLLSSKGKILKLVKIPEKGFFCTPNQLDQPVGYLSRAPFPERISFTELFFTEGIPIDHFIIQEI